MHSYLKTKTPAQYLVLRCGHIHIYAQKGNPYKNYWLSLTLGKRLGCRSGNAPPRQLQFYRQYLHLHQECTWYFLYKEKYKLLHLVCLTFRPLILVPLFDLLIRCVIWAVKGTIELTCFRSWQQAVNSQIARHRLYEVYLQHNCLWTTSCDIIICLTKNIL